MENDLILQKLEDQTERLKEIEDKVSIIVRQDERILNLQSQVGALWRKYDAAFSPEGTIARLQAQASACPKEDLRTQIKLQWGAMALIVALIGALKLWG